MSANVGLEQAMDLFPLVRSREAAREGVLTLSEGASLYFEPGGDGANRHLARVLSGDAADRFGLPLAVGAPVPGSIAFGTTADRALCALAEERGVDVSHVPGPEGYLLDIGADGVLVLGADPAGVHYGVQSLRMLLQRRGDLTLPFLRVQDWPLQPFRGLRMYLPGRDHIPFFKRFVRDFAAMFKYNRITLEVNAAMRFDRHPELNAGWLEFGRCLNETRRDRPAGPGGQFQDSAHHDTGFFGILEKDEVADMVRVCRENCIEVIPEIPSLTHAYYLLSRHRELAEIQAAEWPDTYCPNLEGSYELYFDVLEEYLEVMRPDTVHIGHDEWRMPMHVCERCRGRDYRELFVRDVQRIHAFLGERGVRTAMWGDHLLESVRGGPEGRPTRTAAGYSFIRPGGLAPEQVERDIPKEILLYNWFWNGDARENPEQSEKMLSEWGFEQVFGNFTPEMTHQNYAERLRTPGILGAAPSAWVATTEADFGKDQMGGFVGCAGLLWSERWLDEGDLVRATQRLMPLVRANLRPAPLCGPGEPDEIALPGGRIAVEAIGDVRTVGAAASVGLDVSFLRFTHACERPAENVRGYFAPYNPADSAELLGFYEILYVDGLTVSVPLRYGVNILEREWGKGGDAPTALCYEADPTPAPDGDGVLWTYEWANPRLGKVVQEIRLRAVQGVVGVNGQAALPNAVVWSALQAVPASCMRKGACESLRPGPSVESG